MVRTALILPKNGVVLDLKQGERLYFLAGPIRGAADWQAKAIQRLTELDPHCYIACPCRYDYKHELFQFHIPATKLPSETDDEREPVEYALEFENQTMWERHYLEQAAQYGSVIFWLPCEDKENPRKKEDGPYARDTYGELGSWRIISSRSEVNLTIGAEKDFPGITVIQKNFDADHNKKFLIYSTLEETLKAAVTLGKKTNPQPLFNADNA